MNPHDRDNLNYIMSLNDEEFDSWALGMPDDDIKYAIEIIQAARLELAEQEEALLDEVAAENNFAEANAVLQKFRL